MTRTVRREAHAKINVVLRVLGVREDGYHEVESLVLPLALADTVEVREAGGLDLAILGVGADGHVAYNMPGPVTLATHVTRLPDGLAASLGVPPEGWPLRALTMGLGTIRRARALLVLATGAAKATAVQALVRGPEDPHWPCSFLYKHPDMEVLLDQEAASGLSVSGQGRGVRGPARGPGAGGPPRA